MSSSPSRGSEKLSLRARGVLAVLPLTLLAWGLGEVAEARPGELANGLSGLYERVSPAVVRVVSHRVAAQTALAAGARIESAMYRCLAATGVVVDDHGCVVTTDRVAQPGDSIVVLFPDGRRMQAAFVGQNPSIHISVLQLQGETSFPWLAPRPMRLEELPEWVAAVAYGPWSDANRRGPALTLAQSDALARERVRCADSTETVWRLKAPLFPGNAGGALLSLDGEWLGLITGVVAGEASGGGPSEEGVIVPADLVTRAVHEIEQGRSARAHGFLGVRTYRRTVTASDSLWSGVGVIVSEVLAGGPAERCGIRPGDVILRFGETEVSDAAQLTELVRTTAPGSPVKVEILRAGQPRQIPVQVGDLSRGEQRVAQRREALNERVRLEREIKEAEERLHLLRIRLETLADPRGAAPEVPRRRGGPESG